MEKNLSSSLAFMFSEKFPFLSGIHQYNEGKNSLYIYISYFPYGGFYTLSNTKCRFLETCIARGDHILGISVAYRIYHLPATLGTYYLVKISAEDSIKLFTNEIRWRSFHTCESSSYYSGKK